MRKRRWGHEEKEEPCFFLLLVSGIQATRTHTSEASVKEEGGGSSRATRTTPRTARIGFRAFRTLQISSPPLGGLLICMVLKPLKPIVVFLGLVLVVLEVVLVVVLVVEVEGEVPFRIRL